MGRVASRLAVVGLLAGAVLLASAQAPRFGPRSHVIIPSLANATKPFDLDFQGGECDVNRSGKTMTCQFQQVFLTVAAFDASTCLVTTNRYERVFRKQTQTRWVSREGPEGPCGIVDTATLENAGGARWTPDMRKVATKAVGSCVVEPSELLSWENVRRPLPCTFVQPGSMSR